MKYTLILIFSLGSIIIYGQSDTINKVKHDSKKQNEELDRGFMLIAEQMPMFPACDSLTNYKERKPCADKAMLEFVYTNLQHPKNCAREGGVEGTVVVSFIIKKDGSISDVKIIREVGCGCGDEAVRVVKLMPKWIPGQQQNQPVDVQFNLPIRFRLE